MKVVCTKCGTEITLHETFPLGYYARCNKCCSINEGSKNYVYAHLGGTKENAIRAIIDAGCAKRVSDEVYRKKCIQEEPTVDSVFGAIHSIEGEKM